MTLRFKSSTPETFTLIGRDEEGRERRVVATKHAQDFNWQLQLTHPSGQSWHATYGGRAGILDAMSELLNSKDSQFVQDRARGDRPQEQRSGYSRSVDGDIASLMPLTRK